MLNMSILKEKAQEMKNKCVGAMSFEVDGIGYKIEEIGRNYLKLYTLVDSIYWGVMVFKGDELN